MDPNQVYFFVDYTYSSLLNKWFLGSFKIVFQEGAGSPEGWSYNEFISLMFDLKRWHLPECTVICFSITLYGSITMVPYMVALLW